MVIVLALGGCADFRVRIDPSGEHLFVCDSPPAAPATCPPGTVPSLPPPPATCPPGTVPTPAPTPVAIGPAPVAAAPLAATPLPVVSPYSDVATLLSPYRAVEPVGTQVVMLGGVRGGDGYLHTNRRLEWSLAPGSVGAFTAIGQHSFGDYLVGDFTPDRIFSPVYAIGSTTRVAERAGGPASNVSVVPGQGWVTVSSAVEGVSHVTLAAPAVVLPGERAKSATIYWVDAQYGMPTPAITPAGSKQSLTTTVWRQTTHSPRAGWIVRYELACGPQAVFAPTGTPAVEATTNETGQASVEIFQKEPSPGTNQVRVQVFRPADACGERVKVHECSVPVTWTAPSLGIRQMGPPSATIDQPITYRIEVSNPGDLPAREVVASEQVPDGLSFVQANPAPVVDGRRLEWRFGDLAPRQQQTIEVTFRTAQAGVVTHCVEVTAAGGLRSSHCANTTVLAALPGPAPGPVPGTPPGAAPGLVPDSGPGPGPITVPAPGGGGLNRAEPRPETRPAPAAAAVLELKVTPEGQAIVGANVTFDIDLTNRGTAPATEIVLTDTFGDAEIAVVDSFGDGREHQERSPLKRKVSDLPAGKSARYGVTFRVTHGGQFCHHVEITAAGGVHAAEDSCVAAIAAAGGGPTPRVSPETPPVTPAPTAAAALPLEISVRGPTKSEVGKPVVFTAELTNRGQQPLTDVTVKQESDAGLAVTDATEGGVPKTTGVLWSLGSLPPGRQVRLQVQCACKQAGTACCRFTVSSAIGRPVVGQTCVDIAASAPSTAPSPSISPNPPLTAPGQLDVTVENYNKVTAGKDQVFLIQVTNQGDSADNDIVVMASVPAGLAVASGTSGPSAEIHYQTGQGAVRFDAVRELPPKATISYRLALTTSQPGPVAVQAAATSQRQKQAAVGRASVEVLPRD